MVLLKKTLQVEERYPYPVRLEAMYEVIDQSPMRKLEKLRQKGFFILKQRRPTRAHTTALWLPAPRTTADPYYYNRRERERYPERYPAKTTPAGDNRTDKNSRDPHSRKLVPATHKPSKIKPTKKKNGGEK
ncbi:coiled-coil domain-containing protein 80, partial [Lates japonicus]